MALVAANFVVEPAAAAKMPVPVIAFEVRMSVPLLVKVLVVVPALMVRLLAPTKVSASPLATAQAYFVAVLMAPP